MFIHLDNSGKIMGWRFRKSFKILPGVKLNINKKSVGITFGGKGAHYTVNSKGKRTASIGIPGTGLYYTESQTKKPKASPASHTSNYGKYHYVEPSPPNKKKNSGCGTALIFFICCAIFVGVVSGFGRKDPVDNVAETSAVASVESTEDETESVEKRIMYTTADLNVRSGPGTSYEVISTLSKGTEITVIAENNGWAEIEYSQSPAYVSLSYIDSEQPTEETTEADQGPMVWVSYSGSKYHSNPSCSGMKGPTKMTLKQAQNMGKTPCSKCY